MNSKEILIVADVLLVGRAKETLAKRKVINRIEDVSLTSAIETYETIDILRKLQIR
jgi:hypothetical protein